VTVLYDTHYHALIRLAALLVSDAEMAEEIVQDAFVAMHGAWRRLGDCERALPYLQHAVVRRSRARCAGRPGQGTCQPAAGSRAAAAQRATAAQPDPGLAAIRALPAREREALVLRYYAGMPGTQIAAVMGIGPRTVDSYLASGVPALQAAMERERPAPPPSGAEAGPEAAAG